MYLSERGRIYIEAETIMTTNGEVEIKENLTCLSMSCMCDGVEREQHGHPGGPRIEGSDGRM